MGDGDPENREQVVQPFLSNIHYCAEGVKNDFQRVVDRFLSDESVRYADFLAIWQQLQFHHIFRGRQSREKLRQFTEECLKLATELWIESSDFQVQVCGLYLLYGLYFCQPVEPKVRIRMTLPMWQAAKTFTKSVKEFHHYDVEYVFMKLILSKSFYFVATLSNQNAIQDDDYRRKKILSMENQGEKETPTLIQNILKPDNILKLEVIDQQYQQMKKNLDDGRGAPDLSLSVIQTDLLAAITKDVKTFKMRQLGSLNKSADKVKAFESSAKAQVKEKATAVQNKFPKRTCYKATSGAKNAEVNDAAVSAAVITALGKSAYPGHEMFSAIALPSVADLHPDLDYFENPQNGKKAKSNKGKGSKKAEPSKAKGKQAAKRQRSAGRDKSAEDSSICENAVSPQPSTSTAAKTPGSESARKRTPRSAKAKEKGRGKSPASRDESTMDSTVESTVESTMESTPPTQRRKSAGKTKIKT